jgi:hypothetical protein
MSKNNYPVSVVISTRKIDDDYLKHVSKMFSHPKTEIIIYENNGEFSLPQLYNRGLNESSNDIIVFILIGSLKNNQVNIENTIIPIENPMNLDG